jgi:hypothetical protein
MRSPHPKRKLRAVDVRRIRYLKANKISGRCIGRMYSVGECQVRNIIHGKTYKDVPLFEALNLKPRNAPRNRWPCKLSSCQVRRIRECDGNWRQFRFLADQYHVAITTVYRAYIEQTHRR